MFQSPFDSWVAESKGQDVYLVKDRTGPRSLSPGLITRSPGKTRCARRALIFRAGSWQELGGKSTFLAEGTASRASGWTLTQSPHTLLSKHIRSGSQSTSGLTHHSSPAARGQDVPPGSWGKFSGSFLCVASHHLGPNLSPHGYTKVQLGGRGPAAFFWKAQGSPYLRGYRQPPMVQPPPRGAVGASLRLAHTGNKRRSGGPFARGRGTSWLNSDSSGCAPWQRPRRQTRPWWARPAHRCSPPLPEERGEGVIGSTKNPQGASMCP